MSSKDERAAQERLAAIPGFSMDAARAARIERLPGLTNRVYRVELAGERFALRVPGEGSAAIIDRRVEEINARAAARAGVAPEVLHFGSDGVMLTRFVEGEPLTPRSLKKDSGALQRAALALRRLHGGAGIFERDFEPFAIADAYVGILARLGRRLSEEERATVSAAESIRATLRKHPVAKKPCHCDPSLANLIDTGERVWLVDWEYSGMNEPMWDLAYLSSEAALDPDGERALATAYFGREPRDAEIARIKALKPAIDILSALWALIQHAQENRAADFDAVAAAAFARAAERMRSEDFAEAVKLVAKG